ncbi:hypothetical protein NADRNF5_0302 [Nitrosopumilus adriaticus]|uniref:Uncharacterized protein n=1 Tax=Nitrosopumilus adriaticus TaxID=1580092 RepID=A0A0D5C0Z7_9ARCH|nr:hypothetical protein NADRNF5_0302 [Nitrosopumilus adriaticus]
MIKITVFYNAESTINAINNTAKYGLENLNSVHEAFSIGLAMTQTDKPIINAPDAIAVHRYTLPTIASPLSVLIKNGAIENKTMTTVDPAIARADVFSDCTAVSIGTFTLL